MKKNLLLTLAIAPVMFLGACSGMYKCVHTGEQDLDRTAGDIVTYSDTPCDVAASYSATDKKTVVSNPDKMFSKTQLKK